MFKIQTYMRETPNAESHSFIVDNKRYLFNVDDLKFHELSEEDYKIGLSTFASNNYNRRKSIDRLEAKKLFAASSVKSVSLLLAQTSETKREYWGRDKNEKAGKVELMPEHIAYKTIDWLIKKSGSHKNLDVYFFGEEPILNFPLMQKVVDYAKKTDADKNFSYYTAANAPLINDEATNFFAKHNIKSNIITDAAIFSDNKKSGNTEELSGHRHWKKSLENYSNRLLNSLNSNNKFDLENEPRVRLFLRALSAVKAATERNGDRRYFSCGIGFKTAAVNINGDIYACHRLCGDMNYKIGSVFDNAISNDKFKHSPVVESLECAACWARYFCGGGCACDNLEATGDHSSPSAKHCAKIKVLFEIAIHVMAGLNSKKSQALLAEMLPAVKCKFCA